MGRHSSYRKDPNICQICFKKIEIDEEKTAWVCGRDFKTYIHTICSPDDKWLKQQQRDIKIDKLTD